MTEGQQGSEAYVGTFKLAASFVWPGGIQVGWGCGHPSSGAGSIRRPDARSVSKFSSEPNA